jgi:hypothetical protein
MAESSSLSNYFFGKQVETANISLSKKAQLCIVVKRLKDDQTDPGNPASCDAVAPPSARSGKAVLSGPAALAALKDCSKSAMMSSMCSVPTEIRMASSVTPEAIRSSSDSCSCVVDQG